MRAPDAPPLHGQQDAVSAPDAGAATKIVLAGCPPKIPPEPKSPPPLLPEKKRGALEGFWSDGEIMTGTALPGPGEESRRRLAKDDNIPTAVLGDCLGN